MVSNLINIPRYQVSEELYNGSRTLVYRGYREADHKPVVIKVLKNPYPAFSELVQFRNQYTIAKNLNSPLIIQTYSLESYQNGYVLVMEDFGGISLKEYFTAVETGYIASLQEFLQIAIALCNTLDILYRERIIHKDIKPANILINPETKQVKLIDFSIASLLPRETQTLVNPNVLEGTLAYISPEQTGRMNRGIDYRTDFYSLGVTFYELLTGELPFQSNEPMELVHCHIAKAAPLVHENNRQIPSIFSDIVNKLMAKNAEDRYQSALGLKFDLENCLHQLQVCGNIDGFEIASRDVCDRFIIPDKLYGRETEVETLLQAFERVSLGATEMMLVAGFSGIGKTVVVNEVHKPIVRQHGYFIKGKYDQFQRNIPFSGFVQAFRDLMGQLLTESDAQIQQWRNQILSAVGENGQVIIEVIPELSRIIGEQAPATELLGIAAQNRFNLLFQKFTQVFTSAEHPLVMFLDDLQWADSASLKLMQLLMADTSHLLLIGAYRDNEVNAAHPLMLTLSEIEKTLFTINTITLAPLSQRKVNQLVADTLKCAESLAWNLSQLIYQKTKGNPFFATQFIKALHQENFIQFDFELGCWQCDIAQVNQQAVTDDVVAFMAFQLEKMPDSTQHRLQLAACIGNQFDLKTLAIVSSKSEIETAADLWKALQEGLILPISDVYKFYVGQEIETVTQENQETVTYKFLHDRVQQAAYSLIAEEQKQATHLQIGQLLLSHTPGARQEEKLFDIVNHLNQGAELIAQSKERDQLIQLNLRAGRKAKLATAYAAAIAYFNTGINLLPSDAWHNQYAQTLALYEDAAEVSYLGGDFEQMQQRIDRVLQYADTLLDKVKVYETQIQAAIVQNQFLQALEMTLALLEQLGVTFPKQPSQADVGQALQTTAAHLSKCLIADLADLPIMSDRTARVIVRLIVKSLSAAYIAKPEVLPLLVCTGIDSFLKSGNSPLSTVVYSFYGVILCGMVGDIETGYQIGELTLDLLAKFPSREIQARAAFTVYCFVKPWKTHTNETLNPLLENYQSGLDNGDSEYSAWSAIIHCQCSYFVGENLAVLEPKFKLYGEAVTKIQQDGAFNYLSIFRQSILNLLGLSKDICQLEGEAYSEAEMLPIQLTANDLSGLLLLHLNKAILGYLFENHDLALENLNLATQYLQGGIGSQSLPVLFFYDSLVCLSIAPDSQDTEQETWLARVAANQEKIQNWAQFAPMNHLHKWHLVEAERCRVLGNKAEAIDHYDRAIAGAKANEYIQEEALANELAAKFYLDWGKEKVAQAYIQEAYYCYARWGAKAKTDDLEKRYPELLQPILQQQRINLNARETIALRGTSSSTRTSTTGSTSISDVLDFTSILKAAQTISSSIELDQLITSLTHIILENSGAKKSVLILPQEDTWQVRAITLINHQDNSPVQIQTCLYPQLIDNCQDIPRKIINYVKNTQQTIVIDNCQTDIPGVIGEYMLEHHPKSVLCTPIINQGHLVAILYLENELTSGVFTSERLQAINLLSSQAAISLENARLYQQAQQALQDLQQAQLQIVQSEKMSALGNLVAGVAHEMNNPLGFIAASLQQAKPTFTDIIEHLKLYQESLPNKNEEILDHESEIDLDYSLEDLPKMIDSMSMACDRLKNISTSLRTFSRADKDYKVPFNIHEGIDSTILILKHRLKANEQRPLIEVVTNYSNLPQIECFPGQLNQVFMNLLANAIDALEESNQGRTFEEIKAHPNRITITTSVESSLVKIAILDNGKGMSESVKEKIFDHLFTTKDVGKGTGLGLAIARQIVEETHNGKLSFNSVLGEGTEFIIEIQV